MDPVNSEKENSDPESDNGKPCWQSSLTASVDVNLNRSTFNRINVNMPMEYQDTVTAKKNHKVPEADDFTLLKPISRGAFGKVFIGCKKKDPNKIYAIKVMKKTDLYNKNLIAQVTTERDALAMIHSPFVVQIYYSLQSEQNIYLVMEYLAGGDVKSLLAVYGYLGEDVATMYIAEVTLALEYLHHKGIIHRDLKPDNMLIASNGHIKLTDFGLSKVTLDVNNTPMAANQRTPLSRLDQYRTPGQIVSLRSSLAFSAPRSRDSTISGFTRSSKSRKSLLSSSSPRLTSGSYSTSKSPLVNSSMLTPDMHSSRTVSVHQRVASQSIFPLNRVSKPEHIATPPPLVKSLTPTLKDSLHWNHSSDIEASEPSTTEAHSRSHNTYMSPVSVIHIHGNQSFQNCSISSSDDVFSSTHHELRDVCDIVCSPGETAYGGLDCLSHDRASSRQESLLDSTPVIHRTDESVYKSVSARSLRVFQKRPAEEQPSEEAVKTVLSPSWYHADILKPVPEDNESLPSFQSSSADADTVQKGKSQAGLQISRKRGYDVIDDSAGLNKSCHTGLTQEVCVMMLNDVRYPSNQSDQFRLHLGNDGSNCEKLETSMSDMSNQNDRIPPKIRITSKGSPNSSPESANCSPELANSSPESAKDSPSRLPKEECHTPKEEHFAPLPGFNLSGIFSHSLISSPETEPEDQCSVSLASDGEGGKRICKSLNHLTLPQLETDVLGKRGILTNGGLVHFENGSTGKISPRGQFHSPAWAPLYIPKAPLVKPSHKPSKNVDFKELVGNEGPSKVRCMSVTNIQMTLGNLQDELDITDFRGFNTPERYRSTEVRVQNNYITPQRQLSLSQPLSIRTPKEGVRRGPEPVPELEERILGTPDYLAPEILRQEKHGAAVDWWSLGVCLFEFMTGLPPFNDETPERVFSNILNRAISWPTDMAEVGKKAQYAINALLTMDPRKRPGAPEVKSMELFSKVNWDRLLETEPAFIPQPDNILDTSYFHPRNTLQQLTISAVDL